MTSTRTRNTPGNYDLEQWSYDRNVTIGDIFESFGFQDVN
jgi:hypothetical protein